MSTINPSPIAAFGPHAGQSILTRGPAPETAPATILLVHGRGASAQSILSLYDELGDKSLSALAPQAAGQSWYPHSFLAPLEANQPELDSALSVLNALVEHLLARGVPGRRIALLGFSQGACLVLEFAARHPRRYGAVMGLSGGLIGPAVTPYNDPGALDEVPVFLGAADPDPHVPFARVQETRDVLQQMGAHVDLRRYPGMPHTINVDELEACRSLVQRLLATGQKEMS
jgi:predicted esterase